jgi:integrase
MATGKLTDLSVRRSKPGKLLGDGGNLWLQVTGDPGQPARSWLFRYARSGRERYMGLGSYPDVVLAQARELAQDARKLLREGKDPIEEKRAREARTKLTEARGMTFRECAETYIDAHRAGWKSAKHAAQWCSTLQTYAYPVIGDLPVDRIGVEHLLEILKPIWNTRTETASRLRGRIEKILDWATFKKQRTGENPARWKGHLSNDFQPRRKVARAKHHPALPYRELPAFMHELKTEEGVSARALEFTVLTIARTSETTGARWPEMDLVSKIWTRPPSRMKGDREHRVPLSDRAIAILKDMAAIRESEFVFPSPLKRGQRLSNMAMLTTIRRMNGDDPQWVDPTYDPSRPIVPHGFRSSFRDWASEQTNFANEVCEMALAHAIKDETEAAYRRGDLLEKRRALMNAWAGFCARAPVARIVVPIKRPA